MSFPQGPGNGNNPNPNNNRNNGNPFTNPFNRGNNGNNGKGNKENRPIWQSPWLWGAVLVVMVVLMFQMFAGGGTKTIDTKDGFALINQGKATYAEITDNKQVVRLELKNDYTKKNADTGKVTNYGKNVQFYYTFAQGAQVAKAVENGDLEKGWTSNIEQTSVMSYLITSILPFVIILALFWWLMSRMGGAGGMLGMGGKKNSGKLLEGQTPTTKFADVAGEDEAVAEVEEIKDFLKDPSKYKALGARIPRGVLLYGPPGTGKTLLARAIAGEAGVPFYSMAGSDFVEMFVGLGASRVRDLFDEAKKNAPAIIFIDEIDAVGRKRGGSGMSGGHDEREQTLNQLLVEMDGFAINEGVIVMAATNRRDILDPALLRPGRFDRTILVNYPDMAGRVAILKVHAKGKPLADDVDLENIAKRVPFSTGAELENIMNEAAILAARGRLKAINQQTLVEAISRVQMGPEKRSHKVTQRDKRMVAIHEAGHAIVGHVLPNCDEVHLITIVPRGQAGGYTLSLPTEEDDLQTYSQLMDFVAMGLGGHAAEQLYLGEFTTGATSDLKKATEVCRRMVTQFGMSEKLGPVYLDGDQEVFVGMEFGQSRGYSEEMAARIDAEVKRLLEECYQKAVDALSANRDRMEKLVDALLKYDTISRREFVTLMETGALPDIQDADTRTTGDVMMQDMADEKKKENSEKSAETPEKSAEMPDKTADAPENHPTDPHEA